MYFLIIPFLRASIIDFPERDLSWGIQVGLVRFSMGVDELEGF